MTEVAIETLREKRARRAGYALGGLMVLSFAVMAPSLMHVAHGPPPPGPGTEAPRLAASTPSGEAMDLTQLKGKIVLVDFWATWCPPCVRAMPHLQALHQRYGEKGFMVLGVNQEPGEEAHVSRFMRDKGLSFPTVMDDAGLSGAWGVYSYPTSFLVDGQGKIRQLYRGPASESQLTRDIESLLQEARRSPSHPAAHGG